MTEKRKLDDAPPPVAEQEPNAEAPSRHLVGLKILSGKSKPIKETGAEKHNPDQAAEQKRAADERSSAMKRQMYFDAPLWPIERVLIWIAFRNIAGINDHVSVIRSAPMYKPASLMDQDPHRTLLQALQLGELKAFDKNGTLLPHQAWGSGWREAYCNREDVLDKLPETNDEGAPTRPHATKGAIDQAVNLAIQELKQNGERLSQDAVEKKVGPQFIGGRKMIRERCRGLFLVKQGAPARNSQT